MFTKSNRQRKGNIILLTALIMVATLALTAMAVDLGYLYVAQTELQRTADAAALAAAWELATQDTAAADENARDKARQFAALNHVLRDAPGLLDADIEVGYLADLSDPDGAFLTDGGAAPNAVRVNVRRSDAANGRVPLFFAAALGHDDHIAAASAMAVLSTRFGGFKTPNDNSNIHILPFALDEDTWALCLAGQTTDEWSWDEEHDCITAGADGVVEVNLFPQGTGSPGNRGTVDIGSANNSTNDIARQIVSGISPEDLAYMGGSIELDDNGELELNGDTGISAGVKDELESIKGQPRIIPIFRTVVGPGNNAQYTIVAFAGVRIMHVKLTGKMSGKQVIIQPATITVKGGVPAPVSEETSYFVFSPVWMLK